jgi:hypothetical protein
MLWEEGGCYRSICRNRLLEKAVSDRIGSFDGDRLKNATEG